MAGGVLKIRKPCKGCGGPKPSGARLRYCSDECRPRRMIYYKYGPLPKKTAKYKKEKRLLELARRRAKSTGIPFNITQTDISIPDKCPVLGIPLLLNQKTGFCDNSPTVDRIDNAKGYEIGNVAVVSWRANRLKSNATLEELKLLHNFYSPWYNEECIVVPSPL